MTNKTVTMPLELAERILANDPTAEHDAMLELRALIAAPAVERQEPVAVPVAWMRFDDDQRAIFTRSKRSNASEPLYPHPTAYRHADTSPPAPVAVIDPGLTTFSRRPHARTAGESR